MAVEVTSIAQWNTTLRDAKASNPPKSVIVDWYAVWCQPCKVIAPHFNKFAEQNPRTAFLRVDVEGPEARVIAKKYQITSMPTFTAILSGQEAHRIMGADLRGLTDMIKRYGTPLTPTLPPDAEAAKTEGNKAFLSGDYPKAIEHYSKAIEHAPNSAVLYANRSFAYLKLAQRSFSSPDRDKSVGAKALNDATKSTKLDEKYSKGWVRLAEAMLFAGEEIEGVEESKRAEGRLLMKQGAIEALENTIGLEGSATTKLKTEAQSMIDGLKSTL